MLPRFSNEGFAAYRHAWARGDALRDRSIRVILGSEEITGTARGIDADGALLVEAGGSMRKFVSGEASLRLQPENT
jgi:BirA family biotin operon repressor/biotin-[acetyl-CoA-carboxylase] ligase